MMQHHWFVTFVYNRDIPVSYIFGALQAKYYFQNCWNIKIILENIWKFELFIEYDAMF